MKRMVIRALVVLAGIIVATFVLFGALMKTGVIAVGISPLFHYRLHENERSVIENSISMLHQKMKAQEFEVIRAEIAESTISRDEILGKIKKVEDEFGDPIASEFFRAAPPERSEKYYPMLAGTLYTLFYFTRTNRGEFFEDVELVFLDDGQVKIRNYSGTEILEWQSKTREDEKRVRERFSRQIRIPLGARFIEINY